MVIVPEYNGRLPGKSNNLLVKLFGLHHAMLVPALLCVAIVGLAVTMPKSDADLRG